MERRARRDFDGCYMVLGRKEGKDKQSERNLELKLRGYDNQAIKVSCIEKAEKRKGEKNLVNGK